MKVKEMQNVLKKLNPESELMACYLDDEDNRLFLLSGKIRKALVPGHESYLIDLWGEAHLVGDEVQI